MPKVAGRGQAAILTPEELQTLCNLIPVGQHRTISYCLTFTSARVSEVLQLQWKDITDSHIVFGNNITKTGLTREVNLHPTLKEHLEEYRTKLWYKYPLLNKREKDIEWRLPHSSEWLFKGRKGYISRQAYDKQLRRYLNALSIKGGSTHSYRRSGLTLAKDKGLSLSDIQNISGHVSLEALKKYLAPNEKAKKEVVNSFGW